jgi:hypothetical protein
MAGVSYKTKAHGPILCATTAAVHETINQHTRLQQISQPQHTFQHLSTGEILKFFNSHTLAGWF